MSQRILSLSADDRPREKFEQKGASALSVAELLAILVGSGSPEENAVTLMQRLMTDCGGRLTTLGRMSIGELCEYKGIGPAKAISILAACELTKRRMGEVELSPQLLSSENIAQYFRSKVLSSGVEESHVLLLSNSLRPIGSRLISRGGITGTVVDVRLILKEALVAGATHIVLCHNHPSGSLKPSRDDDHLTEKLKKAAETMDIRLIDHIIVTDASHYSYHDEGRIL